MTVELVWDASGIYHASRADRIDVLGTHAAGPDDDPWGNYTTPAVANELGRLGVAVPDWLTVQDETFAEVLSLPAWVERVGSDGAHHLGEATVLNMAESRESIAIIDDNDAVGVGRRWGVEVHGTLWLIAQQVARGDCAEITASRLVDVLIQHDFRCPIRHGEYIAWAKRNGLF